MRASRNGWVLVAVVLVLAGIAASFLASHEVAKGDGQRARQSAMTSSVQIASALRLAIEREQDLSVNTGAFVVNTPNATQAQFQQWLNSERLFARFPELVGIGEVVLVPAASLAEFGSHAEVGSSTSSEAFQVVPSGDRPYYCFTTFASSPSGESTTPPNLDVCDSFVGPILLKSRDSGQSAYTPYGVGRQRTLAIGSAIYQRGVIPTTVEARRSTFLGWVGIQILPRILLSTALRGHSHTEVAFRYGNGGSAVIFRAGAVPGDHAYTTSVNLNNGWHVQVSQVGSAGDPLTTTTLALLIGGILLSLVLGLLVYVLATGRSRAVALVRERTDELRHLALHDSLTGLPNRALILDRLDQMLARGRREKLPVAALFIDLDNFKDVNDTLGHATGDQLLMAVGARLAALVRSGDTVGRLGGDEFVVLVEGASLAAGAVSVADRVLEVLATPFEISGSSVPLSVTASIGFAEGDRPSPDQLLQDADMALYQAKAAGKVRAIGFSADMRTALDGHRHLEADLHGALAAGEFFLVYQPTVDLSTGSFTGVEALLRWRHPVRGIVMPSDFIPALESSGQIIPVGGWVLEEACRQGVRWLERGLRLVVSVNVSARQLERDRIIDDVDNALSESGLDPHLLVLELTETALMNNVEASMARLHLLKALGIRIAMDDFGTGYSSLAYLRQLPIDILKIDQTFVAAIAETTESAALVHTLVQLGKVLGLETVAEGIETDAQRRLLAAEGVDVGQGYLFAHPLETEQLNRLLGVHDVKAATRVI
jgi:diguanylate cyclase (GGDEF)-like protein